MKKINYAINSLLIIFFLFAVNVQAQYMKINNGDPGVQVNVLKSGASSSTIEYVFNGYYQQEIPINGTDYLSFEAPGMVWLMEKGLPQLPIYRKSMVIPDRSAMNFRIVSSDFEEVYSKPVMPSKGHMTRDIDPSKVPYTFDKFYLTNSWYPENPVVLEEPYIVRDLRGMTIQFNPMQYNPAENKLRIYKRIVIEVFEDVSRAAVNPFIRTNPFLGVSSEFTEIYRTLFMNYGMDNFRYDSIPEPGRLLVIYASQYASIITPFVNWKTERGLTVLTADYPTQTGTGNTAVKTYIQNLYNASGSVTYIILIGESSQIPYLTGVSEGAASDPCYVKLAGTDAYPDAFISRVSPTSVSNANYILQKIIKYERDVVAGAPWYKKGVGIASNEQGSTPYKDWERMNWIRDTVMNHGWTQVDQIYDPGATSSAVITSINGGRSILNYIGHGSGTSWSTSGFNVSNAYSLSNGLMNPFVIDVSCLNGQFTLNECLAEAMLRAGDTVNPKGAIAMYSASTNASWVPPCDMQSHSIFLLANGFKKSVGGICFSGVMKGMDLWGGSSGEGLKLMEQYHIFGDCSMQMTFGVPLGPTITHTPLQNTENLTGPYAVNCVINPMNSNIDPSKTRIFWTRATSFADSVLMTNISGNNWTANIPGNGSSATYRYYIKTVDMMNRTATSPGGAPANYHSFQAMPDIIKPVIVHTALGDCPRTQWPASVSANVTDNIGLDSVWVSWYKNTTSTGLKRFKLNNTSGSTFAGVFNSDTNQVAYNDSIFYRVVARDCSSNHNMDSTALYKFKITAIANACIGTGTTAVGYPFYTFYHDSRTQMLYTSSEILSNGGAPGMITKIGYNVISAASQTMNGFNIKMQTTTSSSVSGFINTGWTTVYTGTYTVPGSGWRYIDLQTPFYWNGTQNLLIEICFDNTSYTSNSTVAGTSATGMTWHHHLDGSSGCTMTGGSAQATRPNICMQMNLILGNNSGITELPKVFSLAQNYPNPFNPVTSIKYSVPKQSLVKLVIYDIIGREVVTLVNEVKTPGNYAVSFDASMYASGVYFYRMESGDFTDVKKMVLIK
jgi:gingipain R